MKTITKEQNEKMLRVIEGDILKCKKCDEDLDDGDEECPNCGEETEMAILIKEKEKIVNILDKRDELLKNGNFNSNKLIAEAILDEKKQEWIKSKKCPECHYSCHHHISKNNHSYWVCNRCERTYNDVGKYQFNWGFD
jgi:RNA polymerase subunit RPABC4/transcription elongation factor Spt4